MDDFEEGIPLDPLFEEDDKIDEDGDNDDNVIKIIKKEEK